MQITQLAGRALTRHPATGGDTAHLRRVLTALGAPLQARLEALQLLLQDLFRSLHWPLAVLAPAKAEMKKP